MSSDMKILKFGTSINILADAFEKYIEKTAEHVTGDVVLRELGTIKYHRDEAKTVYELSQTHEIVKKPTETK